MTRTANPFLRNVAIIAHVDHGKTTLVDALLAQSGSLRAAEQGQECVLDSNPLERERGITILAKNCAVAYHGRSEEYRINIIDTPGHADFGGEVERVLRMADGALLLIDAFEGPMPQTRFVLSKALELKLKLIVVVNKCDRAEARPQQVINELFDLLIDLGAEEDLLEFPVIYASGRDGWAVNDLHGPHENVRDLFEAIIDHVPAPQGNPDAPLQLLVTTLDYSEYTGRIAIGRVYAGHLNSGQQVAICKVGGSIEKRRALKVMQFAGLGRVTAELVECGDICAIEGLDDVFIGDTIADPENPVPMTRVAVDEPTMHMVFRINDSPFAGREGQFVTSRQLGERLQRELQSNVALRVSPGDTPDEFNVSGRGLLHLGVLLETMRREGYELSVGRPEVIEKMIDGERCEPIELLTVDTADDAIGPVIELLGSRGGEVKKMEPRGTRMHIECEMPARGLIGLRSRLLNATGGEAVMYYAFLKYAPVVSAPRKRIAGVMIATETGACTTFALLNLSDRGFMFVQPGDKVYKGQIVGEHCRENDLPANVAKLKALSNVRESNKEATVSLKAARLMSLEQALEYIEDDELVEITPKSVRMRKRVLDEGERKRTLRKERDRDAAMA
jgi:GTP-binding protein